MHALNAGLDTPDCAGSGALRYVLLRQYFEEGVQLARHLRHRSRDLFSANSRSLLGSGVAAGAAADGTCPIILFATPLSARRKGPLKNVSDRLAQPRQNDERETLQSSAKSLPSSLKLGLSCLATIDVYICNCSFQHPTVQFQNLAPNALHNFTRKSTD
jgi:hypothetical protein